jgi:nucleolin
VFQRRWATGEAEAQNEDEEVPISEIQPTPQEGENAVHEDNAEAEAAAATESATIETAEEFSETTTLESAINAASETASDVATSFQGAAESATSAASAASAATGFRGTGVDRGGPRDLVTEPKPTIYVGNLFFDVTENDLVKEMARFGTITKCRLMRDARGLSKG